MRLYRTNDGQWAGTQADAKKIGKFEQIEVPTDKAGLLEFLNGNKDVGGAAAQEDAIPADVIRSGNSHSSPLAYIKDDIGVSEITNLYSNFSHAWENIQHIMSVLGHCPHKDSHIKEDYADQFKAINDKTLGAE